MMRLRRNKRRSGATMVEFAIVTPILFTFVLGLMEWGRFEMVRQVTATAAFNASRHGTLPGAKSEDVEGVASDILEMYFVSGATVTSDLTTEYSDVEVSVPLRENSFVLTRIFGDSVVSRRFYLESQ